VLIRVIHFMEFPGNAEATAKLCGGRDLHCSVKAASQSRFVPRTGEANTYPAVAARVPGRREANPVFGATKHRISSDLDDRANPMFTTG
jgi:hypothetical protein